MLNKDKMVKAEIFDSAGRVVISTSTIEFPKDFFRIKGTEFVILKGRDILPISKGERVAVVFYYMNGTRIKYITTVDVATDMQINVHLGTEYVVMEERRQYFKTATNITGKVIQLSRDSEDIPFDKCVLINILNINIGGIFMRSPDYVFEIGDLIVLNMLDGHVEVLTEILRIQKSPEGQIDGYGCKFRKLSLLQEETVARFIFECQLAEREKVKNRN